MVVGLLLAVLRHHADERKRTCIKLAGSCECLAPYCSELVSVEACGVKLFHLLEVELALEIAGPLLEFLNAVLEVSLLANDAHRVDTLVHTQ